MKIPNRDSGIDSPSSSVASENFPCEEGIGGSPGPAILGLHPETAVDSQVPQDTPQEEEDSGVGEEPDPKIIPSGPEENVGLTQVSPASSTPNIGCLGSARDLYCVTPTPVLRKCTHTLTPHTGNAWDGVYQNRPDGAPDTLGVLFHDT